jgi:Tfp pilus assembly protein FimT
MLMVYPRKAAGVTLLEILLVFVVIATLSVMAVKYFLNSFDLQYTQSILGDLQLISGAANAYAVGNNGSYLGFTYTGPSTTNVNGFSITNTTAKSYTVSYGGIGNCSTIQNILLNSGSKFTIASCPSTQIIFNDS